MLQLEKEWKYFNGRKQRSVSPASMYLNNNEKKIIHSLSKEVI